MTPATPKKKAPPPAPQKQAGGGFKEWPVALGLLVALFVLFHHRLLFGMNYLWEDVIEQHYPNIVYTMGSLLKGEFPFWTPYVFGGMPYLADMQTGLFYPPNWLLFLLHTFTEPGGLVFIWFIMAHVLIFGAGVYFLSRSFGLSMAPALFTGVSLMFCGFISAHVIHIILLYVIAWFPYAFLFLKKALEKGGVKDLGLAALFFGISVLGGYAQYTLFSLIILGAYVLFHLYENRRAGAKALARPLLFFALFGVFSMGLAAVQLFSTLELSGESVRTAMTWEQSVAGSLSFSSLITFLAPKFHGAVSGLTGSTFRGNGMHLFWETALFMGVTPLIVLFTALPALVRRSRLFIFWMVLGLLALMTAFGSNGPLYWLVFKLPLFSQFRHPGRFAFIFSFCFIMASGLSLEYLLQEAGKQNLKVRTACLISGGILAVILLFALASFSGPDEAKQSVAFALLAVVLATCLVLLILKQGPKPINTAALILFAFIELFLFGHTFGCGQATGAQSYPPDPRLEAIRADCEKEPFRLQGRIFEGPGKGIRMFPHLNMGNVYQVPLVEGYNQLHLLRLSRFLHEVEPGREMDLFNVKFRAHPSGRGLYLAQPDSLCARFSLRSRLSPADSGGEAIRIINSPSFNPRLQAVVEGRPALAMDTTLLPDSLGSVRIVKYGAHEITLDVMARANALLFASEVAFPAWKAQVDGKTVPILKTNFLFRGLELTPGNHSVRFYYQSDAFRKGLAVSLACLLALGLLIVLPRFIRRPA